MKILKCSKIIIMYFLEPGNSINMTGTSKNSNEGGYYRCHFVYAITFCKKDKRNTFELRQETFNGSRIVFSWTTNVAGGFRRQLTFFFFVWVRCCIGSHFKWLGTYQTATLPSSRSP